MTSYLKTLDTAMSKISKDVDDIAGIVVAEFSKEAAMDIGEAWAWKVIDLLIDGKMQALKPQTIKARKQRKIYILDLKTPLIETGELLTYIQVIYKHSPNRPDVLELGILDTSPHTSHGSTNAPSMKTLAAWNEYGFTSGKVSIPARPVFKRAALEIGYEAHRMITKDWTRFIRSRTMQRFIKGDSIVATGARSGHRGAYTTDVGFTSIGRIYRNGTSAEFYFEWDKK